MAAPVVGDDVALVLLVSLSTALTLPSFFAPTQHVKSEGTTDLTVGKLALLLRVGILPWIAAVSWVIAGFDVATLTTVGGFPLFYVSWFFWGIAVSLPIYGLLQLTVWSDINS
jgi:hypothetical protein